MTTEPPTANHRLFALWAADCAERTLSIFERECSGDDRPRRAIEAARAWSRGEINCGAHGKSDGGAVEAASAAHAAARSTDSPAAAHIDYHALGAAVYARRALMLSGEDSDTVEEERRWQIEQLPSHLLDQGHMKIRFEQGIFQSGDPKKIGKHTDI
jgi:hypothetical protein